MSIRMVLRSSDSKHFHPNNTTGDFNVHLPVPLDFTGNWTVALTKFTISRWSKKTFKPELYVCSDVVEHTVVGESEIPLLRRVYVKGAGNQIFDTPYQVPLRITELSDLRVYIRNVDNVPASFLQGEVSVTLVFRRLPF